MRADNDKNSCQISIPVCDLIFCSEHILFHPLSRGLTATTPTNSDFLFRSSLVGVTMLVMNASATAIVIFAKSPDLPMLCQ